MHVGEKLRKLRVLKGLTQEDIAQKVNKTRALVSYIEKSGKVNYYTLQNFLDALEFTEQQLNELDFTTISFTSEPDLEYRTDELVMKDSMISQLQEENRILRELNESQKKIIAMMEKKLR